MNHPSLSPHESPFGLPVAYTCRKVFREAFSHLQIILEPQMTDVTRVMVPMPPHLLTLTDFQLSFYVSDCTQKRGLDASLLDRAISIQAFEGNEG